MMLEKTGRLQVLLYMYPFFESASFISLAEREGDADVVTSDMLVHRA